MEENDQTLSGEEISFGLIANAGQARSLAFQALASAKSGDFDAADELLAQSKEASLAAHHQQTELLTQEARGNHMQLDVLLVHAQDHLMTAMLAQELIEELITLYKIKQDKEN